MRVGSSGRIEWITPATVLGMSWNLRSRKMGVDGAAAFTAAIPAGPSEPKNSRPSLMPTPSSAASDVPRATASFSSGVSTATKRRGSIGKFGFHSFVIQSVSYFTVPPRAHPSAGSQSGSASSQSGSAALPAQRHTYRVLACTRCRSPGATQLSQDSAPEAPMISFALRREFKDPGHTDPRYASG